MPRQQHGERVVAEDRPTGRVAGTGVDLGVEEVHPPGVPHLGHHQEPHVPYRCREGRPVHQLHPVRLGGQHDAGGVHHGHSTTGVLEGLRIWWQTVSRVLHGGHLSNERALPGAWHARAPPATAARTGAGGGPDAPYGVSCVAMNPMVKYSLARLGMFVLAAALVIAVPVQVSLLIKLAAAIIISAALSFFLLRGLRDQVAEQLAAATARRAASKQELRAALAGEAEPAEDSEPGDPE